MSLGDGIRRNIATVSLAERHRLRDAILALNRAFYAGGRNDTPTGGVTFWFKQDEIHAHTHVHNCPAFLPWHRELVEAVNSWYTWMRMATLMSCSCQFAAYGATRI